MLAAAWRLVLCGRGFVRGCFVAAKLGCGVNTGNPPVGSGNTPANTAETPRRPASCWFASDGASRRPIACIVPFGETHPFVPYGAISERDCAASQQGMQSRSEIALSVSQMVPVRSERAALGPVWNNTRCEGAFSEEGTSGARFEGALPRPWGCRPWLEKALSRPWGCYFSIPGSAANWD